MVEKLIGKGHLKDSGLDEYLTLILIFRKLKVED